MDWLDILTFVVPVVFPPAAGFILPAKIASKINIVTKVVKGVGNALEAIDNTKGGLTAQKERG